MEEKFKSSCYFIQVFLIKFDDALLKVYSIKIAYCIALKL